MGDAGTILPSDASLSSVFADLQVPLGGNRPSTELSVIEILRKNHPEFAVTATSPATCDLFGFAAAGLATAQMKTNESFDISRSYVAPRPRIENKMGALKNHVRFGRWLYTWKQAEFIVYEVEYQNSFNSPVRLCFILSPRLEQTNEIEHPAIDELLMVVGQWTTELHNEIYIFDDGRWSKSRELFNSVQGSSWEDVILNPEMKRSLMKDVRGFFNNKDLYKKLAVPWKRGLILHGVPGNGKTISIKAIINELQKLPDPVPSLYVKSLDTCRGKKVSVRSIFTQARTMAPCFLIFEDLDSLVDDDTRSYFLNEVDGLESNDGILMVGSTNHLDGLDPAISKRPSRFDRKYHFKIPSMPERILYCQFWRQKLLDNDLVDFPEEMCPVIAELTDHFSFAYLKELFVITLLTVVRGRADGQDVAGAQTEPDVEAAVEEAEREAEQKEAEQNEEKKSPPKRTMPEVEIPASLSDNVLLKVLQSQLKALLVEMDNTKEGDWLSSKVKKAGAGKPSQKKGP